MGAEITHGSLEHIRGLEGDDGRAVIFLVGLGAVSTTMLAGLLAAQQGHERALIGSLAEMGYLPDGDGHTPLRQNVDLLPLGRLSFAAWDITSADGLQAAERAGVLKSDDLALVADGLKAITPMPGVYDPRTLRRIEPDHTLPQRASRRELIGLLRQQIRSALTAARTSRGVCLLLMSTEPIQHPQPYHGSLDAFEQALDDDAPGITPTQLYTYACLQEGIPVANGTPNLALELPALQQLAHEARVPIAGRDLKTGQTLLKTALAPVLKARHLGLHGWFSTNILGNRDGLVLDDPEAFQAKEKTKGGVLDEILQPSLFPSLYGDAHHKVQINYYPPRGDQKEGWDNIDIFGWMGYPMQIKVNFLCRDSILAAPLCLDLALFLDLARRAGQSGPQDWLSFYFKDPLTRPGLRPVHHLFLQESRLHHMLRTLGQQVTAAK